VVQRGGDDGLLAVANLTANRASLAALELGGRQLLLSTEDVRYGGNRSEMRTEQGILPHELLLFGGSGGQP